MPWRGRRRGCSRGRRCRRACRSRPQTPSSAAACLPPPAPTSLCLPLSLSLSLSLPLSRPPPPGRHAAFQPARRDLHVSAFMRTGRPLWLRARLYMYAAVYIHKAPSPSSPTHARTSAKARECSARSPHRPPAANAAHCRSRAISAKPPAASILPSQLPCSARPAPGGKGRRPCETDPAARPAGGQAGRRAVARPPDGLKIFGRRTDKQVVAGPQGRRRRRRRGRATLATYGMRLLGMPAGSAVRTDRRDSAFSAQGRCQDASPIQRSELGESHVHVRPNPFHCPRQSGRSPSPIRPDEWAPTGLK